MSYVQIDDWEQPSRDLEIGELSWWAKDNQVVHVPAGFGTAFRALQPESKLLVFADVDIDHAKEDDYTYTLDYFSGLKKK